MNLYGLALACFYMPAKAWLALTLTLTLTSTLTLTLTRQQAEECDEVEEQIV